MAKVDEQLDFMVLEFSKENKKILVSHTRTWKQQEEQPNEDRKKDGPSAVRKINDSLEKTTLGDIDALASLKEEMDKAEIKEEKKKRTKKSDAPKATEEPIEVEKVEEKAVEISEPEKPIEETPDAKPEAEEAPEEKPEEIQ
jgi:small subunit ribosomal protein S1